MPRDVNESGRRSAPRLMVQCIDPALRLRSQGDAGIRRTLEGLLGQYLDQRRIDLTALEDTLFIACRDRGSATELRFLQREIRKILNASGHPGIERVRVVLSEDRLGGSQGGPDSSRRSIPAAARLALRSAAMEIRDPVLAEALRRLARAGMGDEG
jgi:hypothetical protein